MIHRPPEARSRRGTPAVIFFHGFTGDRMESHWIFVKCARALAASGVASLRFDFFGSGESEGEFRDASLETEVDDAQSAVEFLRRYRGINPSRLGLLGLSLGGAIAAIIARKARASALVLWSAVGRFGELAAIGGRAQPVAGLEGALEYGGHAVSARFLEHVRRFDPLEAVANFKSPALIIHPERDELLSLAHPDDYYRALASPIKEKVIIPGADHTFSLVPWEREVIRRTVSWFRDHLLLDGENGG